MYKDVLGCCACVLFGSIYADDKAFPHGPYLATQILPIQNEESPEEDSPFEELISVEWEGEEEADPDQDDADDDPNSIGMFEEEDSSEFAFDDDEDEDDLIAAEEEEDQSELSVDNDENCSSLPHSMWIAMRHIEAGGIGYHQGYSTLEGFFVASEEIFSVLPFLDLRGHVFNDGRLAANAGLGLRKRLGQRIYGINAYYDYRDTQRHHYNQVSVGLEALGRRWDFRINGYLPVGDKISSSYQRRFNHFSGHHMYISRKYEFAMKGADAEVGVHFGNTKNFDFYTATGPYYFVGPLGNHAWGGKARLAGSYKSYVTLEISDSYDNVFNNNFQGQLTLSLPFGPKLYKKKRNQGSASSCSLDGALANRIVQPIARQEIVVLNTHRKKSVAINPITGKPYFFWFVNNQSLGNGTFESPFATLSSAQLASSPNDVIDVYRGDGTTTGLTAITLQNNQKLWGAGISQHLKTTAGKIKIPALAAGYPMFGPGVGSSIITCANGNEISGISLNHSATSFGIDCTASNSVRIQNNMIFSNIAAAQTVNFNNSDGLLIVRNNRFQMGASTAMMIIQSSIPTGAQFVIDNNQFLSNPTLDSTALQWGATVNSFRSINIQNNLFSGLGSSSTSGSSIGIFFGLGAGGFVGSGNVTISTNQFVNSGSQAGVNPGTVNIPILSGGNIKVQILSNQWTNSQASTASLAVTNYGATSQTCLKMTGNTSDASATAGGITASYFLNVGGAAGSSFTADISSDNTGIFGMNDVVSGSCP